MDDANFSGRHDNMDNSESAVDSVTKLKEYLISAIREWSRILVGKDKSRENIWLPAQAPKWWLHTYPPWRNPTGKKKDTLEELKIKYNILQGKLLDEGRFPKQWEEQTDLYQSGRYQDLFLLTRLIKVAEELREKEQELKKIVAETFNISNFSAASVVECLVKSGVSIQSEVKKLQEKLGRNFPLDSKSDNLSVENYNNNSPTVVNCGQKKIGTVLLCSKTIDTNKIYFSPPFCIHTTPTLYQHSPHTTTTSQTHCPQTTNTPQQQYLRTTNTVVRHSPTTSIIKNQSLHKTTTIQQHSTVTLTTQQQQSPHTTTTLQKTTPTLPTHSKLSLKRTATECDTDIFPKFPKVNSQTLQNKNPENSINLLASKITRADLSLDISETDEDKTTDDTSGANCENLLTVSPDEGFSSEGFMSDLDSSPEIDHKNTQLDVNNDHQDTPEQEDLDSEDENFDLFKYVLK
ncbi:uncharacterized protein LOC131952522 [Physella acuta]|uniref:uncharacterized protein LOC131952522 n=1 Tax=Physella acuta TaxID=109671 RepID=UPI0027DE3E0B|nr:uncharacterized protein LOC131952522 [Physella acuta]